MPPISPSRRNLLQSAVAFACAAASPGRAKAIRSPRKPRVLIVATNVGSVGDQTSGTFLMEIALPFQRLTELGCELDVITPRGGPAAIYHAGDMWPALAAARDHPGFVEKVERTLSPEAVRPDDYAAIYFPGGHGQFWDVVEDPRISAIAAAIHSSGGAIGTAGHGAASLVNVRLASGRYLVEGKRMTCFPWWAETEWMAVSDYGKRLPFDMEDVLRRQGAVLVVCTKETMRDENLILVADEPNRMITGSFATSAVPVAEGLHRFVASRL